MPKFDLSALIRISPIDEQVKAKLLTKIGEFTVDERFELTRLLWGAIAQVRELSYLLETEKILNEVESGKKKYNASDFTEVEAKLKFDLKNKIEDASAQELLSQVRENLKIYSPTKTK